MIDKIIIFLLVLSSVFLFTFIFKFLLNLFSNEPKTIETSKIEIILLYLSISYIITHIII
jgi:VIT1/CCC1 family predicted Fe2+/Mn2+ transporter